MIFLHQRPGFLERSLLACVAISAVVSSVSWGSSLLGPADRFVRTFGHPTDPDFGLSVVEVKDGYVIAGNTLGYGEGHYDGFLTKVDFNGDLLWSKAYGTEALEFFYHLVHLLDGGFLAVGLYQRPRPDGGAGLAVRTDPEGELLWSREFPLTDDCITAVETHDGGFAIACTGYALSGNRPIFLIRLDKDGNLIWTKTFGGSVKETPYALFEASDGGFLIAGDSSSFFPRFGPYVIKTSDSGSLVWSRRIFLWDETGYQYEGSVTFAQELSPGEFLLSGWLNMSHVNLDGFLTQISSEGEMRWFRRFRAPVPSQIDGFDLTSDGQIIALQTAVVGTPFLSMFAVDLSGQVTWSNRLDWGAFGNQIHAGSDGSVVLTGFAPKWSDPSQTDVLVVKLDNRGNAACNSQFAQTVVSGDPTFDGVPTVEGEPSVTPRDYPLQVNAAMDSSRGICTP